MIPGSNATLAVQTAGWLAWLAVVVETWRSARLDRAEAAHGWRWRAGLVVAFLALRWPLWLEPQEHSPDESQCLVGALTLLRAPVFWQSVDGGTAGPLHYYLLMPAALLPGSAALVGARLIGHGWLLGAFFLTGGVVARVTRPIVGQIAVVAAVSAAAFSRTPDLQHASTELLPAFLIALALAVYLRPDAGRWSLAVTGLALGLAPWAKLQSAPIAAGLGLAALILEWRKRRPGGVAALMVGALLPTFAVAAMLSVTDGWHDMLIPYAMNNAGYADVSPFSRGRALRGLWWALWDDGQAALWLASGAVLIGFAVGAKTTQIARRFATWLALLWLGLAITAVVAAQRPFLHYWHFLSAPWLLATGVALGALWETRADRGPRARGLLAGAALGLLLLPLGVHRLAGPEKFAQVHAGFQKFYRENEDLATIARPYVRPGDRLAVWGSRSGLHLALHLPQATRQAHSEAQIHPGLWQPYFLRTYWQDFDANRPAFFADAQSAGNLLFGGIIVPHENFAPLAAKVRRDYTLLTERHGVRLYVRNDRFAAVASPP